MDPTPILDGIVAVVQANPKTAAFVGMIPITQLTARFLLMVPAIKSTRSTWLNRALAWYSRWPGPKV